MPRRRHLLPVPLLRPQPIAKSARIAAAHGFRVVDVRVVARRSYEGLLDLAAELAPLTVREATESDLAFARGLAIRSHRTSRFYFDGGFPRDRCDALYRAWVERGSHDPDRRLLIGVVDDEPVGYIVCGPLGPDREGSGELVAIDERHRGKGYGHALSFAEYRDYAARGGLAHRGVIERPQPRQLSAFTSGSVSAPMRSRSGTTSGMAADSPIPFNRPGPAGDELAHLQTALESGHAIGRRRDGRPLREAALE